MVVGPALVGPAPKPSRQNLRSRRSRIGEPEALQARVGSVELGLSSARPARKCDGKRRCGWAESGQRAARAPLEDAPSGFQLDCSTARLLLLRGFRISSVISKSRARGIAAADWLRFMSSSLDLLAPSLETAETTKEIIVPVDASPFEVTTGEKRKREGGRVRSKVWQHFTKLEKRLGEREECRCNYCGNLYVCSSKSGTTHLNRHIFEGGCPKYKPTLSETQNLTSYPKDDLDDDDNVTPLRVDAEHSTRNFSEQEVAENLASELVQLKEENTKLLHEKDDLAAQKTSLEQLIVTMATETARIMEENTKLKEECAKLQEEKQKTVTREEFVQLETQVSKLREDFERDRRGFPAATMAALAHLQNGR